MGNVSLVLLQAVHSLSIKTQLIHDSSRYSSKLKERTQTSNISKQDNSVRKKL